jgi:hypothetical protein
MFRRLERQTRMGATGNELQRLCQERVNVMQQCIQLSQRIPLPAEHDSSYGYDISHSHLLQTNGLPLF